MENGNVAVLVDAKEEYTKQLVSILKPCIYQGIKSIYMDAKDICHQDNSPDNVLMVFQDLLSRIPKWSQDIISKEYDRISSASKCDYIDDLLKVVYVSHIKVLTIVHSAQKNKKISIKVPSGSHFIHLCYIECAREFWKDPYLFSDRVSKYEHQKNMRDSENMISECIAETIRKQLPVRHILKEFLNEPDEEIEEEDEDIKDPVNKKYLKKLETVVKKELKNSNKGIELDMDLIRKVIREEMDSRSSSSGVISESSVIKKELVDIVVEKIVEQSVGETEKIEETIILPSDTNNNILPSDNSNINTEIITLSTENITLPTDTTDNIVNNTTLSGNNSNETNNETNNESLDTLLNEQDFKGVLDTDILKNIESKNNIIDIKTDSVKDEIDNEDKRARESSVQRAEPSRGAEALVTENKGARGAEALVTEAPLVINDIDEINLNLDELDEELGGDIDLDSLQTVDLKSNSNEVKKDPNTKYIFFKDV
jgi:hypothetical protein